jgi:hypothetical protein
VELLAHREPPASSKYSAMGDELGTNSRDLHHIAKNTCPTCPDQLALRYASVIVSEASTVCS